MTKCSFLSFFQAKEPLLCALLVPRGCKEKKGNLGSMKKQKIELRIDSLEKAIIEKKAESSGLSVSEFVRRSALNQKIDYKFTEKELEVYKDLHHYRHNFILISNMIKGKDPELAREVKKIAEMIKNELTKFQ
jgi:hypothetical protein